MWKGLSAVWIWTVVALALVFIPGFPQQMLVLTLKIFFFHELSKLLVEILKALVCEFLHSLTPTDNANLAKVFMLLISVTAYTILAVILYKMIVASLTILPH